MLKSLSLSRIEHRLIITFGLDTRRRCCATDTRLSNWQYLPKKLATFSVSFLFPPRRMSFVRVQRSLIQRSLSPKRKQIINFYWFSLSLRVRTNFRCFRFEQFGLSSAFRWRARFLVSNEIFDVSVRSRRLCQRKNGKTFFDSFLSIWRRVKCAFVSCLLCIFTFHFRLFLFLSIFPLN